MFFDPHVHTEGLGLSELRKMRESGVTHLCSLYFYPIKPLFPQTLIDGFRKLKEFESFRCSLVDLDMIPAVGIHPRCIPPDYKTVLEHLEANEWTAFGEIGLEVASKEEIEVFSGHLMIAMEKDLPCIIHTPGRNKREITMKTLEILSKLNFPPEIALIDHVNFENLDLVADGGYWVGLTVQQGKLTREEAVKIVEEIGEEKCILNSDVGFGENILTTVPETAKMLGKSAKKVCFENAKKFLGV
ncbi:MAG: TatD family hydrolase [Archaeoglobaceae archaeon]|nr:TatD family hydrolase [Archaeoglobaceae archaeon]MDW8127776.1 TatD family hydrolase [Archaeoglobaceae archaeon]